MSITISLDPAIQNELEAEASSRAVSCEQIVCEALEDYLQRPKSPGPEYDAWFKARYEEGKAAYERGDVCSHAEVKRDMAERRMKYLKRLAKDS